MWLQNKPISCITDALLWGPWAFSRYKRDKPGFLSLSAVGTWGWMSVVGHSSACCMLFSNIRGLYPLTASKTHHPSRLSVTRKSVSRHYHSPLEQSPIKNHWDKPYFFGFKCVTGSSLWQEFSGYINGIVILAVWNHFKMFLFGFLNTAKYWCYAVWYHKLWTSILRKGWTRHSFCYCWKPIADHKQVCLFSYAHCFLIIFFNLILLILISPCSAFP